MRTGWRIATPRLCRASGSTTRMSRWPAVTASRRAWLIWRVVFPRQSMVKVKGEPLGSGRRGTMAPGLAQQSAGEKAFQAQPAFFGDEVRLGGSIALAIGRIEANG